LTELPRYLPDEPWPAYAYHPGQDPHPTRDPAGHSHGVAEDESPAEPAEAWARSRRFLLGVDLFNHGYAWEAHEAWESMWLRPAERAQAELLQALIQLAAARVQQSVNRPDGRARLCHRALDHLRKVHEEGHRVYMGLELEELQSVLIAYAADPESRPVLRLQIHPA
jgi:predicted metal-dependent hydrolase